MGEYVLMERPPTVEEYQRLRKAVGWGNVDIDATEIGLCNSLFAVCAVKDGQVIGYSFPFFNREIDRKIIRNMLKLKKIYFQAPNDEPKKYIDRFRSIMKDMSSIETEQISDVKQFFLPPEL